MTLPWDQLGSWQELTQQTENQFLNLPNPTLDTNPDITTLFNTLLNPDSPNLGSLVDLPTAERAPPPPPPPQPRSPTPPQTYSTPDIPVDTPTPSAQPAGTPSGKPGSAPRPKRWSVEEEGQMNGLVGERDGNALRAGEWDQIAGQLGTGRTGTAVKGKWQKTRDPAKGKGKGKGKVSLGGGKEKGGGGTRLKHEVGAESEPNSPIKKAEADLKPDLRLDSQHNSSAATVPGLGSEPGAINPAQLAISPSAQPNNKTNHSAPPSIISPDLTKQSLPRPQPAPPSSSPTRPRPASVPAVGLAMAACLKLNPTLAPDVLGLPPEFPVAQGNGPWSPEEDSALLATVMMYTAEDWAKVANKMGTGRGAIECEKRMKMIGRTPLPAIGLRALKDLGQVAMAPAVKASLGDGLFTFRLDDPLPTLPSVPSAVQNYNHYAQASGAGLSGGYVAPTNSTATLPQQPSPWNSNPHRPTSLVTSLPISPHIPVHSPPTTHFQPQPQPQLPPQPAPTGSGFYPPQSRRGSSVYGAAYPVAPPPTPAPRQTGPVLPPRRASYDRQQRQELATLAGLGMHGPAAGAGVPAIATPRIPAVPSLGSVGGGVGTGMGSGGFGMGGGAAAVTSVPGYGHAQVSSPPPPVLPPQQRPAPFRRPSVVPYIYSPDKVGPESAVGAPAQWPWEAISFDVARSSGGMASGGQQQRPGPVVPEPFVQSPVRTQPALLPRVRTPFGPKSANQLPRALGMEALSPVKKEADEEQRATAVAVATPVRPVPRKKRSSSGSVEVGVTRRVTRSTKEEVGAVWEEEGRKEGEQDQVKVDAVGGADGEAQDAVAGMDVDAEGSVEPEAVGGDGVGQVPVGVVVSPRVHLKRKCTSPSYLEGEKGRARSYVEVEEEVVKEEEE